MSGLYFDDFGADKSRRIENLELICAVVWIWPYFRFAVSQGSLHQTLHHAFSIGLVLLESIVRLNRI